MKYINTILAFCLLSSNIFAQNNGWKELEEKVIGWDKAMPSNGEFPKKTTLEGFTYSRYRVNLVDTFINWIKKSYTPVGGLPQAYKTGIPSYSPEKRYPKGTGVYMRMWAPAYDATGKKIIKAQPASGHHISIFANVLSGLNELNDFSTADKIYFTTDFDYHGKMLDAKKQQEAKKITQELQLKVGNYLFYYTGYAQVVLIPGNKLPFTQVTFREFFIMAETAINRFHTTRKGNEATKTKQLNYLSDLKNKYSSKLEEPLFLPKKLLTVYSFDKTDIKYDDILQLAKGEIAYPLYKFDEAIMALCKKDQPQWVTISFPYANEKSKPSVKTISEAMINKFNFQYVYDYFFNPEKVKGKGYQPR